MRFGFSLFLISGLFATSAALVTNPYTFKKLPYDSVKDFVPVAMAARSNHVLLVNPDVKARMMHEYGYYCGGARALQEIYFAQVNSEAHSNFIWNRRGSSNVQTSQMSAYLLHREYMCLLSWRSGFRL